MNTALDGMRRAALAPSESCVYSGALGPEGAALREVNLKMLIG
jgi:hypothetical protein